MDLKKTKKILSAIIYLMIILLALGILLNIRMLYYVCIAIAVIYTVLYMKFWRCPHCDTLLGRTGGTHCPQCEKDVGIKLRIP